MEIGDFHQGSTTLRPRWQIKVMQAQEIVPGQPS